MSKVVLALMAGLFVSSPYAWAQISLVQVTSCGPGTFPGTSCTISPTGSGNLIVVGWQIGGQASASAAVSSVTDNVGNSYAEAGAALSVDTNTSSMADIWYAKNSLSGATSIVLTPNVSVTNGAIVVWEFSGVDTSAPLDQAAVLNNQATTGSPSGATVTNTANSDVIVSLAAVATYVTGIYSGNPFTDDSTLLSNGWAHLITSSPGTYSAQWNQNPAGTYGSSTASFKASGSISACDLNQDGAVNILDVELATDMALAPTNCTAPFGQCNLAFVQAVLTSAMPNGTCVLPVLGVAPSSIAFGNVTVGGSSTQTVTLTGTGTASLTISQAMASGAGFSISGLSLPLTLSVGQTASFNVTFAPTTAGYVSGSIAFGSSALDTPFDIALSGTGVAQASHYVSLNWTPSTSSNVASYNIYRITSTSQTAPLTPYPLLGSMSASTCSSTACAYTDSGVQAGSSYWYYAAAVDTSGNISAPSNIVPAVVP